MRRVHDERDQVKKNPPQPIRQPTGDSTTEQPTQPEALLRSLQHSAGNAAVSEMLAADSRRAPVASAGGERLPASVRRQAERKLGTDLSDVRIHADGAAHEYATALGAEAVTLGQDVYFRDGAPDATTSRGQKLYVHELTHAAQAERGHPTSASTVSNPHSPAEREASAISSAGLGTTPQAPSQTAPATVAHRMLVLGEELAEMTTGDVQAPNAALGGVVGPTAAPPAEGTATSGPMSPLVALFRATVLDRIQAAIDAFGAVPPDYLSAHRELTSVVDPLRAIVGSYAQSDPLLAARLSGFFNALQNARAVIEPKAGITREDDRVLVTIKAVREMAERASRELH